MKYAILIFENEETFKERTDKIKSGNYWAAYKKYTEDLTQANVLCGGNVLKSGGYATTVMGSGEKTTIKDGPFIETKEQLGGFYIIEVPSLDEALIWAEQCPASKCGAVEVRPLEEM